MSTPQRFALAASAAPQTTPLSGFKRPRLAVGWADAVSTRSHMVSMRQRVAGSLTCVLIFGVMAVCVCVCVCVYMYVCVCHAAFTRHSHALKTGLRGDLTPTTHSR